MARNRQRAKDRQAARRAQRHAGKTGGDGAPRADARRDDEPATGGGRGALGGTEEREERLREADLEVGAPPEDLGRSDQTLGHSPMKEGDVEELEELEEYDFEDEEQPADDEPATPGPRGVRGARRAEAEAHGRSRLVAFLIAVWAELQRVQWPNRKQTTQMTAVVLVFCLIAGGYLGLLDAIFSELIKAIL